MMGDGRLDEKLRRLNSTERQHHLKSGANPMNSSLVGNLHTSNSLTFEGKMSDQCVSENSQVRPVHVGKGIRAEYRLPISIADYQVDDRGAAVGFHQAAVLIFKGRNPDRACSFHHGRRDRVRVRLGLDKNGPSCSAILWVPDHMPT